MTNTVYSKFQRDFIDLERKHAVTVLLSCENSSRSWNYNSADSDNDVFFIYKQNDIKDYVGFGTYRETFSLESAVGWNLKKALTLAAKSNTMLVELVGVAYTQPQYSYVDNFKLKAELSEFILRYYSPFVLAKSYQSTVFHHLSYDYNRFSEASKKQKHLLAGLRSHILCHDYHTNGLENVITNYSKDFLDIHTKMFDEVYETDFVSILDARRNGVTLDIDILNKNLNILLVASAELKTDTDVASFTGGVLSEQTKNDELNRIFYSFIS